MLHVLCIYITLHYITLHCIALHYITYIHICNHMYILHIYIYICVYVCMCLYIYIYTGWLQYLWVNSITEQNSSTIQRPRISPDHPDPGLMGRSWHRKWLLPQLVACCERDFLWKCPIDEQFGLENGIEKYSKMVISYISFLIWIGLFISCFWDVPQRVEHDKLSMSQCHGMRHSP